MKAKTLLLLILTLFAVGLFASTEDAVKLADADKFHLQALEAKANFEQLWMQNAINTIIEANPQLKSHRDLANQYGGEYQALQDKLWTDSKLSKSEYRLDPDKGQFTKVASTAVEPDGTVFKAPKPGGR